MGLFDRIRAGRRSSRTLPPPLAPKPSSRPSYELTVDIGGEVSRLSIPIDLDEVFTPEANRGPDQTASQCWVPPGKTIEIGGQSISGGLVFLGENLRGADKHYISEPALIDPSLEVGAGQAGDSGYWSSYQSLSPAQRGAYLRWLAGPRRRAEADQTQLFVYFYGLERRLLVDPKSDDNARAERGALVRESSAWKAKERTIRATDRSPTTSRRCSTSSPPRISSPEPARSSRPPRKVAGRCR